MGLKRFGALLAVSASILATAVEAQTVSVTAPGNIPNIGNVTAAASGTTAFRVSTAGAVTVVPGGGGTRQSVGTVVNTITLSCAGGAGNASSPCNANNVIVRVTPTTTQTGRAQQLKGLQIAMGTAVLAANGAPTYNGEVVTFTIQPIGRASTKTFRLGLDFPISGGFASSGAASSSYRVDAGFTPSFTASGNGAVVATTRNPTSISKISDLSFGAILPLSGQTGTISVDATNGNRASSNMAGVLLRPGLATTRAAYTIQGEGGQMIAVSVPPSFVMTGPGGSITVSLSSTADPGLVVGEDVGGMVTVPGSPGSAGTIGLGVGGSFMVTGPMTPGAYTGNFNVVFSWN
jgi:hypothetical protein